MRALVVAGREIRRIRSGLEVEKRTTTSIGAVMDVGGGILGVVVHVGAGSRL